MEPEPLLLLPVLVERLGDGVRSSVGVSVGAETLICGVVGTFGVFEVPCIASTIPPVAASTSTTAPITQNHGLRRPSPGSSPYPSPP